MSCFLYLPHRIWFTYHKEDSKSALQNALPSAIGYLNIVPKCLDSKTEYPVYEDLPETYTSINEYMAMKPLDGICLIWQFV